MTSDERELMKGKQKTNQQQEEERIRTVGVDVGRNREGYE